MSLLIEDGRMSSAEIARRLGNVSERAVRYRIERLRERKTIDVRAVVSPRAVGLGVTADIMVEGEPALVRGVAEQMAQLEWVSYVAFSTGARDLSIQVYARDNEDLHRYVTDVVGRVPGYAAPRPCSCQESSRTSTTGAYPTPASGGRRPSTARRRPDVGSAEHPMDDFVITFFNAGVGDHAALLLSPPPGLVQAPATPGRRPDQGPGRGVGPPGEAEHGVERGPPLDHGDHA